MEISKKMDLQVASLKTVLESLKLETIRYLAGKCQAKFDGEYWWVGFSEALEPCYLLLHSHDVLLSGHRSGGLPLLEVMDQHA